MGDKTFEYFLISTVALYLLITVFDDNYDKATDTDLLKVALMI